jgi:hypothetical protein
MEERTGNCCAESQSFHTDGSVFRDSESIRRSPNNHPMSHLTDEVNGLLVLRVCPGEDGAQGRPRRTERPITIPWPAIRQQPGFLWFHEAFTEGEELDVRGFWKAESPPKIAALLTQSCPYQAGGLRRCPLLASLLMVAAMAANHRTRGGRSEGVGPGQ